MTERSARPGGTSRFEMVKWILAKQEQLRSNNISRASALITASALLTAVHALLLGQTSRFPHALGSLEFFLLDVPLVLGFLTTVVSLCLSLSGAVNIWHRSRSLLGGGVPDRTHFHSGDTVRRFASFEGFRNHLLTADDQEIEDALLADLWTIHILHRLRYDNLRSAARLLVIASVLLCFDVLAYGMVYALSLRG